MSSYPRIEVPLRGWDTVSPVQSRARNLRLMNGVLTPRNTPTIWVTLPAGEELQATERFNSLALHTLPHPLTGELDTVLAAVTDGYLDSGEDVARLYLKRFDAAFMSEPVWIDDTQALSEVAFVDWALPAPEFFSLGEILYVNLGCHVLDLTTSDPPCRLFQCDPDARNPDGHPGEYHQFAHFTSAWVEADEVGIATHTYADGIYTIETNAADFTFSFLSSNLIPPNTFEVPFFLKFGGVNASSQLGVEFYDADGVFIASTSLQDYAAGVSGNPVPDQYVDLSNPGSYRRRSVFLNPRDIIAQGSATAKKVTFVGSGFDNPAWLKFRLAGATGPDLYPDGFLALPMTPKFCALTYGSNVADLPGGVAIPSDLQVTPEVYMTLSPQVPRDGYRLSAGVFANETAVTEETFYFVGEDGVYRAVPVEVEDITTDGVTSRYAFYWDLFEETQARSETWKGWKWPHLEGMVTPLILSSAFWNGRLVLSTSEGQLWVSDAADSFAFGGDSDGEILDLPRVCYQILSPDNLLLSMVGGAVSLDALFLVCDDGIRVLTGSKGAWQLRLLKYGSGRVRTSDDGVKVPDGSSKTFLLMSDGVWNTQGEEITRPIRPELDDANIFFLEWGPHHRGVFGNVQESDTGSRYVWFYFDAAWSKDVFDPVTEGDFHVAAYLPGEGMVYAFRDGLYKLDGTPVQDWEWSFDVRFPENVKVHRIQIEGTGKCKILLNNLAATEQEIELPYTVEKNLLQPEAQKAEATVTLSGVGVTGSELAQITRVWLEVEPLQTAQGGNVS